MDSSSNTMTVTRATSPADVLRVMCRRVGSSCEWHYDVDNRFTGVVRVAYPFALDGTDERLLSPISVGIAVFLGQLCLARRIELDFPATIEMVEGILPLAEMLYDVRCWKDGLDLMPPPAIECLRDGCDVADDRYSPEGVRSCLLWSGGKDSTLSALTLRKNQIDVCALHVTANAGMEDAERRATQTLADRLQIRSDTLRFEFPQFLALSTAYAKNWNRYPLCNTVPFGRDMALALLACLYARHRRTSYISMGHEHDCKTAYFTYQGKSVPRNDVESTRGALALEQYIQRFILPSLHLLPPLAPLPEFRVLYEMLMNHPDLASQMSFCFWGNNCGRCSKCLRYSLAQRVLGCADLISYQVNPLEGENCPELLEYLENWQDEATLFCEQVLYGLGRLVQRDDMRPWEVRVEKFRDVVYPHIASQLDMFETSLMTVYSDPQVPQGFVVP